MKTYITNSFTYGDFCRSPVATRLGIDNSIPQKLMPAVQNLAKWLQGVEYWLGLPIHIESGYRCLKLSRVLNPAAAGDVKPVDRQSQHCKGEAADIIVSKIPPIALGCLCYLTGDFDQLIFCDVDEGDRKNGWIHISVSSTLPNRGDVQRMRPNPLRREPIGGTLHDWCDIYFPDGIRTAKHLLNQIRRS